MVLLLICVCLIKVWIVLTVEPVEVFSAGSYPTLLGIQAHQGASSVCTHDLAGTDSRSPNEQAGALLGIRG